ncbi:hypothetical protein AURDEDRAFT_168425 [Auricularia subglabra TFB-10046 SS5]|nr:hypothetical protein AURDEDRAFT_168425 [Auricularia subglabra TFB-10046 SS5]
MPAVPVPQEEALARAREILASAGLDPRDAGVHLALAQVHPQPGPTAPAVSVFGTAAASLSTSLSDAAAASLGVRSTSAPTQPALPVDLRSLAPALSAQTEAAIKLRNYSPLRARRWNSDELRVNPSINKCTRQLRCAGIVEHPLGAVVEYPETGSVVGESIAHRFPIDPSSDYRPQGNFQYSLSNERHGSTKEVECLLLVEGQSVKCKSVEYGCGCLRMCAFKGSGQYSDDGQGDLSHSFTTPSEQLPLRAQTHAAAVHSSSLAEVEVFHRTLGFFCGLMKHGCSLRPDPAYTAPSDDESGNSDSDIIGEADGDSEGQTFRDRRSQLRRGCTGAILMKTNSNGHSYLECEHRGKDDPTHLIFRNLQDLDIPYLRALLEDDGPKILDYESRAASFGVAHWHRDECGKLAPGLMVRNRDCAARFRIFEPHDVQRHPFVLVVCTSPHSHQPPERSKTPPLLRDALKTLLVDMRWQLADATPRKIVQDSGFIANLRRLLDWGRDSPDDPTLAALHPSLGNLDHVEYLIEQVRTPLFPSGTDFEGARHLRNEQSQSHPEYQYVRYAEELTLPGAKKTDKMVICMLPEQSRRLLETKRVEVDISFKRVTSWYEYEMVTWDHETSQSVTLCRAFMTSMSAEAHLVLYRELFKIAEHDTGQKPCFHHLHGDGFEIWTADDDKGHALGLGMYLQELAQDLTSPDKYEPEKRLCDLSPYDHLARFLRLCTVHFKHNIKRLEHRVRPAVYKDMWSLAATETHTDFLGACERIWKGGTAAANWIKEKELFALAALYQPLSKIPLDLWLAGNPTTNGVEQKHRDIYRDGKSLTLMGGINRGMQHDLREIAQVSLVVNEGIDRRYNRADHTFRQYRRIQRSAQVEKRKAPPSGNASEPRAKRASSAGAPASATSTELTPLPSYLTTVPVPVQQLSGSLSANPNRHSHAPVDALEVPPEFLADYDFLCTFDDF